LDFGISDQSLFWLFTFFIEDTKVVPYFRLQGVKRSSLDDVLKGVTVISVQVVNNSKCCPISCFSWIFKGCFLKEL